MFLGGAIWLRSFSIQNLGWSAESCHRATIEPARIWGIRRMAVSRSKEPRSSEPFSPSRERSARCSRTATRAKSLGPLAAFDAGYTWVEHPYRQGVVLIGEAAAVSDPSFGQGMALTLRDARVLRDALLGDADWERAGHQYAEQHDHYFQAIHKVCGWLRRLFQEQGPEADARRTEGRCRRLPRI